MINDKEIIIIEKLKKVLFDFKINITEHKIKPNTKVVLKLNKFIIKANMTRKRSDLSRFLEYENTPDDIAAIFIIAKCEFSEKKALEIDKFFSNVKFSRNTLPQDPTLIF